MSTDNTEISDKKTPIHDTAVKRTFPIVAMGASAGGLDAIKRLLENMSQGTGLAFIIIQHLAPNQESLLPEILSRSTKIPVKKVENNMQVEPDQVYVIPPGKTMTIANGHLKLQPKGISLKPIDKFLSSLAIEAKTQAIGIVLSGTGSDGTDGLKAINAEGGITFAQDPKTAQYPDMPKSAIAEENVDFVLPPEQIARELSRIAKHPEIIRLKTKSIELPPETGTELQTIFTLLKASFGVNFTNYKKSTVNRRITRRMILNKIETLKDYTIYLRSHKNELQALFDDLLIGVTSFFREPETFQILKDKVFPEIFKDKQRNKTIRVWIPGCSTGEEVYSIAIAIEDYIGEKNLIDLPVQIFGTDINAKNIEKARRGIYPKTIADHVSESRLKRFFVNVNENYQVIKQIRDRCVFAKHDITQDPPFSNLNLILCRNMLIYFDTQLQERIIPLFNYALKPNGYLVLGESESIGKFNDLFEPIIKNGVVFRKKFGQPKVELPLQALDKYSEEQVLKIPKKADYMTSLKEEVDHLLMTQYVPATLLVNSNGDIIVIRGQVNPYISIEPGTPSFSVAKMVRKELRPAIQTAIFRAKKAKKDINETVRFDNEGRATTVKIQVKPFKVSKLETSLFIVLLEETTEELLKEQKTKNTSEYAYSGKIKDRQIKELSEDLESTKHTLQTVIEQQEATNEELRSANEEVQSSNEELMSTNEELETSKEELQSTNEELSTLNDELKNRNQNLSLLNDDLSNLMDNIDTAVIIVDSEYKIRRLTFSAQELLRLTPSDISHPITEIRMGIPINELEKSLSSAISRLTAVREEIKTERNRWYQMRVRPYLTQDKKIAGAVVSFSDITELKRFENEKKLHTETLELQVREQADKIVRSETLVAIGTTAGMVGHDIRNPLQAIAGDVFLVKSELSTVPEGEAKEGMKESLMSIEKNVDYINKIVQDLQDFAKHIKPTLQETDIEALCTEVVLKNGVPENIVASCQVDQDAKKLIADPSLLKRILSNLVNNAVQAMPDGGKLALHAYRGAGELFITIQDTGEGISEEVKPKLFTPLFTTKSKGQGFGLAVVKRMTEALGGTVAFESELGKGTKFILKFPCSK